MPEMLACFTNASDGGKTRVSCNTDSIVAMLTLLAIASSYSTARRGGAPPGMGENPKTIGPCPGSRLTQRNIRVQACPHECRRDQAAIGRAGRVERRRHP